METPQKSYTKYIIIAIIIVAVFVVMYFASSGRKPRTETNTVSDSIASSTTISVSDPVVNTPVQPVIKDLLQAERYIDENTKFSIYLPENWTKTRTDYGSSTSQVWFKNGSSTILVSRFQKTTVMDSMIERLGSEGFLKNMTDLMASSTNLKDQTYSKVSLNGVEFLKMTGTYTGKITKRPATQYIYVALTPDAYYRIGADAYTDTWTEQGTAIRQSVASFKIIP
jgi:hypothetical protein